jgi:hypothetical protein
VRILKSELKQCQKKECFKETWKINDDFDGHCCGPMSAAIRMCDIGVDYDKSTRSYDISTPGRFLHDSTVCPGVLLYYCPWCSKELPEPLFDKMEEVLAKEYNLTDNPWSDENKHRIPAEFLTDEWWKKRGL